MSQKYYYKTEGVKTPNPTLRTVEKAKDIYQLHVVEGKSYTQVAKIIGNHPRHIMKLFAWYKNYLEEQKTK